MRLVTQWGSRTATSPATMVRGLGITTSPSPHLYPESMWARVASLIFQTCLHSRVIRKVHIYLKELNALQFLGHYVNQITKLTYWHMGNCPRACKRGFHNCKPGRSGGDSAASVSASRHPAIYDISRRTSPFFLV